MTDSFPGPVVPGRCGGVTVVMNCLHSPVCHVLQCQGDRPGRRERGGDTATGSTISSGACMNNCGKRVKHGCSHSNIHRCGDFQRGQVFAVFSIYAWSVSVSSRCCRWALNGSCPTA